ncbi:hypothetical protein BT96DRAFT_1000699 [Gymnopus androsaceus JB14]|uniref:Uncharacterized protein n=1 Tax=Gymnopus androsaceus JB14 TaxID=1447944 RepID=A0A6A4H2T0_9AGAR|nr:hypothetical protein BT96DRAFT_1000699 [Gymnopus androsaceus JB14]
MSPEPVVLMLVVQIAGGDSELRPDAGYRCPTRSVPTLSAAKLRVVGRRPSSSTHFQEDYTEGVRTLDALLDKQRVPYIGWKGQGFTFNEYGNSSGTVRKISFEHNLFKSCSDTFQRRCREFSSCQKEYSSIFLPEAQYFDRDDCWGTLGWPVRSARAKEELQQIVHSCSHRATPLPLDVELSSADAYKSQLAGRLMLVRFTVSHIVDDTDCIDYFMGKIISLEPILPWDERD